MKHQNIVLKFYTKNRPIRLDGRLNNLPKSEQNGFPDELAWSRLFALFHKRGKNIYRQPHCIKVSVYISH
jgi:hypothetical protein